MAVAEYEVQNDARSANASFRRVAAGSAWGRDRILPFLCECADALCVGRIEITGADYGAAHDGVDQYVVLRNHQVIAGERVIEDRGVFLVTAKNP
jgi:hypothetical protein